MITIHQCHRRTDRRTTCDRKTALCTIHAVHRAVKIYNVWCCVVCVRSAGVHAGRHRPQCDGIEATASTAPVCGSLLSPPSISSASVVVNFGPPRPSTFNGDHRTSHNSAASRYRLPADDWRTVRRLPYHQLQRLKYAVATSNKTTTV